MEQRNKHFYSGSNLLRNLTFLWFASFCFLLLFVPQSWAGGKVATGVDHTAVILSDGTLWTWGANDYGQVGDGTTNNRLTPFQVGTDSNWVGVTAGKFYTIALKSDGTLWAWGINVYGTLGDGTTVNRLVPVRIGTDTDWAAVSAGSDHTLALKLNGTLWAWGRNQACEIGNGTKDIQSVPVHIGTDSDWSAIAAASSHSMAIKTSGALWAWGANGEGQLGNGTTDQSCIPTRIGTDSDWSTVAGGNKHALAIKTDKSLWAWGDNVYGQLGTGSTIGTLVPVLVSPSAGWETVSLGKTHTLAIKDDDLWSWGDNTYGQLGNGSIGGSSYTPWIAWGGPWLGLSAGEKHGVAVFADNSIWTWGNNEFGQLGNGTTQESPAPNRIALYTVTTEGGGKGTLISCSPWFGSCDLAPSSTIPKSWGASVWLKVVPNSGYGIDTVTGCGGTLSGDIYTTGPIMADCTVTATFIKVYTVTATAGQYGSIKPSGSVTVAEGATASFTVTPNDGADIETVTGCNGTLSGNIYTTAPITADCAVNATFKIKTYTINASAGTNGTITPSGEVVAIHGSDLSFTMTPSPGYHVETVLVDGVFVGPFRPQVIGAPLGDPYTHTLYNVTANHTISASFAPNPSVTITATAGANGSISPSGSVTFLSETDKTFTITPAAGYFTEDVQVDGVSVGAVSSYTFTKVMANHTINASFRVANNYEIQASAGPNGSINPSGAIQVNEGSSKSFSAAPDAGYRTAALIVDGVNYGPINYYTFTNITADHTISATFSPTITSSGGANGNISPSGTMAVASGSDMTYTITPYAGYHVADVLVDGVSAGAVSAYTFTNVTIPHTISVTFAANPTYIISATAGANGTITPSGDVAVLGETNKSFTITPDSGYKATVFVDGVNYGSPMTYTFGVVTANHTISATFSPTITSSAGANGNIIPSGTMTVASGSDTTYTITPYAGYHVADVLVDGVSTGVSVTDSPLSRPVTYTFTNVTVPHTISAVIAENPTYIISATTGANGTITPSGDVAVLGETNKSFTITPDSGYKATVFVDGVNYGSPMTYTFGAVTANHTISATFSPTITSSSGANGTISPKGTMVIPSGSDMTYTITPYTGYHIADVLVDGVSAGAVSSYTFTNVTIPHTISVTFAANPAYIINATAGANGTITPSGDVAVLGGTNKSFTITPNSGYKQTVFVDGANFGSITNYTFAAVTANHSISATFSPTITSSSGANGTISPKGTTVIQSGSDMTYTITPYAGYHIEDVLVDGVSAGAVSSYTFTNVTIPHTISVTFAANPTYIISATAGANGTITPSGDVAVLGGTNKSFTIKPNSGYKQTVFVDGANYGSPMTYTFAAVAANHTISATFSPTITSSSGANGTISPRGTTVIPSGSDMTYTMTPYPGYHVADVLIDGVSAGAVSSYTFTNVTIPHTISVTFAAN